MNSLKGRTIFITGGAGFIGSHLVESWVKQGANVIVYDNFTFGHEENLDGVRDRVRLIKGDILDQAKLTEAMRGADFVSHHAAELEILKSTFDPVNEIEVNTVGSINVFRAAGKNNVKKIINASSACIYGQPQYSPQDESHPHDPNWAYGVSKLAAEKYGNIMSLTNSIPIVHMRYGIVYGPREWFRRVMTLFIKRAVSGEPLVLFERGQQYRDYVNIKDIVELNNRAMLSATADNQAYNGSTGRKTTIEELAKIVKKVSGNKDLEIVYEAVREGEESKLVKGKRRNIADLEGMCLSYEKAKSDLGWEPSIMLESGIAEEMEWYRSNPQRWKKIVYSDRDM